MLNSLACLINRMFLHLKLERHLHNAFDKPYFALRSNTYNIF